MRIRARYIYPVSRPPLENGGLFVSGDKIAALGDWSHIESIGTGEIIDLEDSILLPGLINAHCHLDYTDMAGMITPPRNFPDWIKAILALKAGWSFSEYAASWLHGAEMLLRTGTTTVADIEAVPELIPDLWADTPLRVHSFFEMTGVKENRPASAIVEETLRKMDSLPLGQHRSGLSPHALYSTRPELLNLVSTAACQHKLRVTMHLAESREEFEMYNQRRGPLFDWLRTQRDMSDCDGSSPVQQLARTGILQNHLLAVHVNYLGKGDAQLLAENHCSVVHCPSSHAYFKHDPFPFHELRRAGVNICLGTDSLASCTAEKGHRPELNLFFEMQQFAKQFPNVPPSQLIELSTTAAANALQLGGKFGQLAPNAFADFIALPQKIPNQNVAEAIVAHQGALRGIWINGQRVTIPDREPRSF